jgi:hypothetical protein
VALPRGVPFGRTEVYSAAFSSRLTRCCTAALEDGGSSSSFAVEQAVNRCQLRAARLGQLARNTAAGRAAVVALRRAERAAGRAAQATARCERARADLADARARLEQLRASPASQPVSGGEDSGGQEVGPAELPPPPVRLEYRVQRAGETPRAVAARLPGVTVEMLAMLNPWLQFFSAGSGWSALSPDSALSVGTTLVYHAAPGFDAHHVAERTTAPTGRQVAHSLGGVSLGTLSKLNPTAVSAEPDVPVQKGTSLSVTHLCSHAPVRHTRNALNL